MRTICTHTHTCIHILIHTMYAKPHPASSTEAREIRPKDQRKASSCSGTFVNSLACWPKEDAEWKLGKIHMEMAMLRYIEWHAFGESWMYLNMCYFLWNGFGLIWCHLGKTFEVIIQMYIQGFGKNIWQWRVSEISHLQTPCSFFLKLLAKNPTITRVLNTVADAPQHHSFCGVWSLHHIGN